MSDPTKDTMVLCERYGDATDFCLTNDLSFSCITPTKPPYYGGQHRTNFVRLVILGKPELAPESLAAILSCFQCASHSQFAHIAKQLAQRLEDRNDHLTKPLGVDQGDDK